ncbi:hypothetical protein SISSUDRAFT_103091 [Sistotremastrum suecicum HHB10207 ss-3]|uniref:Uncharacterized protein n=1 Tax=Sistotremastrum suecicum HHB10207 ss-3 TaxID=1314776 RepID=A0A166B4V8_9AGAM|nr:hypothetical protein SISSUDRAFT_101934 [Sistotremastrum suecicum HHB10207 ss-3]KZT36013.1 hypothetical protein SISSUDRAFT_103091 [Sistotremastrum suecicum HHB10207 ss-3]
MIERFYSAPQWMTFAFTISCKQFTERHVSPGLRTCPMLPLFCSSCLIIHRL